MRRLRQPGPATSERIVAQAGRGETLRLALRPGLTLVEAIARLLAESGFTTGAVTSGNLRLSPFRYFLPGPSPDSMHVAWFNGPHAADWAQVERANATFGWRDGAPYLHCHAVWIEPDGTRRGGHIIPEDTTLVAAETAAEIWATRAVEMRAMADAETNFSLFQPAPRSPDADCRRDLIVARIRPNEDVCEAIERLCAARGIGAATLRGSLGSLIGARFTSGDTVTDHATEVLVADGRVEPDGDGRCRASLDLLVADMRGRVHTGQAERGENPVCITFELFMQVSARGNQES